MFLNTPKSSQSCSESEIMFIEEGHTRQIVNVMLFSEYLHEKAEESRHNKTVGYLITIIGSVFL